MHGLGTKAALHSYSMRPDRTVNLASQNGREMADKEKVQHNPIQGAASSRKCESLGNEEKQKHAQQLEDE